jgi:glycosyltransferase involved in cell wall biosynthesis
VRQILVGSHFMQQLMARGGAPLDKIALLAPVLLNPSNVRESEPGEPGTILFAGRVTPEKGLKHLIQALAMTGDQWHLIVAGEGPDLPACQALAAQLNIADRIEFLDWVDSATIKTLYQRCSLMAVPSLWPEPFGRVGPEAFVHSRPVVAYSTGGVPDWLDDGETGFLVTPGDIGQLSRRLHQLLTAPALCWQMGEQAKRRALSRWDSTQHIERLVYMFNEAITTGPSPKEQS